MYMTGKNFYYILYNTLQAFAAPTAQQWPSFYQCRGLCSLPGTYEMLVKGCGPELVDQSKRLHDEMGDGLGKFGGGSTIPPSISYQTLLSSCLPPIFLPYPNSLFKRACDTRSVGVSRITPDVYRGTLASQSVVPL